MTWSACRHHLASLHGVVQPDALQESCKIEGQSLPSLRATVISAAGDELELDVCSVAEAKLSIMKTWHIALDCQTLFIGGRQCHDGESLFGYVSGGQDARLVINLITLPAKPVQDEVQTAPPVLSQTPRVISDNLPSAFAAGELHEHTLPWQPQEIRLTEWEEGELLGLDVAKIIGCHSDPSSLEAILPVMPQPKCSWQTADLARNTSECAAFSEEETEGKRRANRRPSKKKRRLCNKIVEAIVETYANDPERLCMAASFFAAQCAYVRALFDKKGGIPISDYSTTETTNVQIPDHIMDLWDCLGNHAVLS